VQITQGLFYKGGGRVFKLPKPTPRKILNKLLPPKIFFPAINPIKYPRGVGIFWVYEIARGNCEIIITPKKYSLFGELLETRPPRIILNPLCRKPPLNPDPETEEIREDIFEELKEYYIWMIRQQKFTWDNYLTHEKAEWEMMITPTNTSYTDFPGNAFDQGNYALGDYILYDGRSALDCFVPENGRYFKEGESRSIYKYFDDNGIPVAPLYGYEGSYKYEIGKFPIDEYGNFVWEDGTPFIFDEFGIPSEIVPENEIAGEFNAIYPRTQKGISLTCKISIRMKTQLPTPFPNPHQSPHNPFRDQDFGGQIFSDTFERTYTWDIYLRENHHSPGDPFFNRTEDKFGNISYVPDADGLSGSGLGGGSRLNQGWRCFEFYIPGEWLITNLAMARNQTFFYVDDEGVQEHHFQALPYGVDEDIINGETKREGVIAGYAFITQNPETAHPRPMTPNLPVYQKSKSYAPPVHPGTFGTLVAETFYKIDEMPAMNQQCCDDIKKLIKVLIKRVGEFPVSSYDTLLTEDGVQPQKNKEINSIAEYLTWHYERLDELMGEWESTVKLKSKNEKGEDVEEILRLPNLAEATSEIFALTMQTYTRTDTILNIATRILLESAAMKQQDFKSYKAIMAMVDWMNFATKEEKQDMPLLCNPSKPKSFNELLKETDVPVSVINATDKHTLNETLYNLMFAASIIKGTFYRRTGNEQSEIFPKMQEDLSKIAGNIDLGEVKKWTDELLKKNDT
jgi:hypothetical protein